MIEEAIDFLMKLVGLVFTLIMVEVALSVLILIFFATYKLVFFLGGAIT